jgi:hypothetical protein
MNRFEMDSQKGDPTHVTGQFKLKNLLVIASATGSGAQRLATILVTAILSDPCTWREPWSRR